MFVIIDNAITDLSMKIFSINCLGLRSLKILKIESIYLSYILNIR